MTIVIIKHYEQNEIVSFVGTFQAIFEPFFINFLASMELYPFLGSGPKGLMSCRTQG